MTPCVAPLAQAPLAPFTMPEPALEGIAAWCARLKNSDRKAYELIFRDMHDALLRYAIRYTSDAAVAADLVQDVFVKLWQVRETLDPNRSLRAFLFRLVRNLALNHQRNQAGRRDKEDLVRAALVRPRSRPDEDLAGRWLKDKLDVWIADLPKRQREALLLSRHEGLRHDEIALVMGVSPRTVNNHMVKALKHLHRQIQAYEPDLMPVS